MIPYKPVKDEWGLYIDIRWHCGKSNRHIRKLIIPPQGSLLIWDEAFEHRYNTWAIHELKRHLK